ncbi:hypothetical protein EP7_002025 [Isosphaeraceae bacterium EP7]
MAKPLKIMTDQGLIVLQRTREQAMADTSMAPENKRIYLLLLAASERHRDRQRVDIAHEAAGDHRRRRPKLGKARRRRCDGDRKET